jgi:ankyrin repeat protein
VILWTAFWVVFTIGVAVAAVAAQKRANAKEAKRRRQATSLHLACYRGQLEQVRQYLAAGSAPNSPAAQGEFNNGSTPKPLNCVAIAWDFTDEHLEIARLLIAHGAIVDSSVLRDYLIESAGTPGANDPFRTLLDAAATKASNPKEVILSE